MTPRLTTPARIVARRECVLHSLLATYAAQGNTLAFEACRRRLAGWSALRSMLATDEPHDAWLN